VYLFVNFFENTIIMIMIIISWRGALLAGLYVFSSEKKMLRYQPNNCLKRTFAIKVATTDDFCSKWKPSRAYHKIDTFRGEQRWMGHKGGPW